MKTLINDTTPIWQLTVGQLKQLMGELATPVAEPAPPKWQKGLAALAAALGVGRSKAIELKQSGILDDAIFQDGRVIMFDADRARELYKQAIQNKSWRRFRN